MIQNDEELRELKESLADIVLLKHGNVWPPEELASLRGEREGPLECSQFSVDRSVTGTLGLTFADIRSDLIGREVTGAILTKERKQVQPASNVQISIRLLAVHLVVGLYIFQQLTDGEACLPGRDR
jgi:hypothetical protein